MNSMSKFMVSVHRDKQCKLIHNHISCRLLIEGNAPKPLLNTEFHPVTARSANALKGYAKAPFPLLEGMEQIVPPLLPWGLP